MAVKQLDRNGLQGNREFLVEVLMLSLAHHANLVSLIGYCADGDQRILVYEYMPSGSLEEHLFGTPKNLLTLIVKVIFTSCNTKYSSKFFIFVEIHGTTSWHC